jgi:hypothetical protein
MSILKIILLLILTARLGHSQTIGTTLIRFPEFSLEIEGMSPFDDKELDKVFPTDMAFSADLGETLQGSIIKIVSNRLDKIRVEQKVETSVTIMNEGPHCDLINWTHFTSNWTRLEEIEALIFAAATYNNGESTRFPNVDMAKLAKAAEKKCGEGWAEEVQKCKSVNDYPCGVGVSRYFIKVLAVDKVTGKKIERTITIHIPMGC